MESFGHPQSGLWEKKADVWCDVAYLQGNFRLYNFREGQVCMYDIYIYIYIYMKIKTKQNKTQASSMRIFARLFLFLFLFLFVFVHICFCICFFRAMFLILKKEQVAVWWQLCWSLSIYLFFFNTWYSRYKNPFNFSTSTSSPFTPTPRNRLEFPSPVLPGTCIAYLAAPIVDCCCL